MAHQRDIAQHFGEVLKKCRDYLSERCGVAGLSLTARMLTYLMTIGLFRAHPKSKSRQFPADIRLVCQLIDCTSGNWNNNLIHSLFEPRTTNLICNIPVNKHEPSGKDRLLWLLDNRGLYSTRSAYRSLTMHPSSVGNGELYKKLWTQKEVQPRILHFSWRIMSDALLTNERRERVLLYADIKCSWCHLEAESASTLFLTCSVAQEVWKASKFNSLNASESVHTLEKWINDGMISKEILKSVLCTYGCNGRLDANGYLKIPHPHLLSSLPIHWRPCDSPYNPRIKLKHQPLLNSLRVHGLKPNEGFLKINVDGVVGASKASAAIIVQDHEAINLGSEMLQQVDMELSEASAVRMGILQALNHLDI